MQGQVTERRVTKRRVIEKENERLYRFIDSQREGKLTFENWHDSGLEGCIELQWRPSKDALSLEGEKSREEKSGGVRRILCMTYCWAKRSYSAQ